MKSLVEELRDLEKCSLRAPEESLEDEILDQQSVLISKMIGENDLLKTIWNGPFSLEYYFIQANQPKGLNRFLPYRFWSKKD
ncbi:MAG: hypothetical protein KC535_05390, partial [Nanoarchaeota archaeon]|nr:hypothetical protein [Nanoarchaeota archaeon]